MQSMKLSHSSTLCGVCLCAQMRVFTFSMHLCTFNTLLLSYLLSYIIYSFSLMKMKVRSFLHRAGFFTLVAPQVHFVSFSSSSVMRRTRCRLIVPYSALTIHRPARQQAITKLAVQLFQLWTLTNYCSVVFLLSDE